MKNRLSIGEMLDVLETKINLLTEKADGEEHIGKIKAISSLLEERVKELYRRAN